MTNILSKIHDAIFSSSIMMPVWTVARVFLGYEWFMAGYEKVKSAVWVGDKAGVALTGFVNNALTKTAGEHPDVSMWYAWFLKHAVLPYAHTWSQAVAYGELLVGIGLILGALTFLSAFFGFFMNLNYLLAGTVSVNPTMLLLSLFVMLSNKVSGQIGLDRFFFNRYR